MDVPSSISNPSSAEPGVPTVKVLVLSDYPVVRLGLRSVLKAPDLRIVGEAEANERGLRAVQARRPAVILIGSSGSVEEVRPLLQAIKEKSPSVSVILIACQGSPESLSSALALGCSGYLNASARRPEILRAVRAVARGECVLEPGLLRAVLRTLSQQDVVGTGAVREPLSVPEREVLRLITEGQTNRYIAQRFGYSMGTVKDYVQKIIRKLEVSDRTQAAVKAVRLGLVE